jgi:hypothetical protein
MLNECDLDGKKFAVVGALADHVQGELHSRLALAFAWSRCFLSEACSARGSAPLHTAAADKPGVGRSQVAPMTSARKRRPQLPRHSCPQPCLPW